MIKLFDRYILKELFPPFAVGLLVYTFVLLMNQILLLSEYFIDRGIQLKTVLSLLLYLIPAMLAFTVPMSVLMGILAGLSRLSSDSEVTAFKTLGISNQRLLRPVLLFSFCGWLVTSFLLLYITPRANYQFVRTFVSSVLTRVQFDITPREFNENIPGAVLYIQEVAPDKSWRNVFVHISEEGRLPAEVFAEGAQMRVFGEEKRAVLELFQGRIHTYHSQNPEEYQVTSFEHREVELDVGNFFASTSEVKRVREKDIRELWEGAAALSAELDTLPEAEQASTIPWKMRDLRRHWIEIHKKFALPFACFIFALLGIALGATTRKGGRTSGFTISIAIITLYYVLITGGENLAVEGHMAPWLGMWGPNILLTLCGLYFFVTAHKEWGLFPRMKRMWSRPKPAAVETTRRRALRLPRPRLRFPSILDRYVIRKYLAIFALGFFSLMAVFIIIDFFERIADVYQHGMPLSFFLEFLWFKFPQYMHYVLPVSALIATLLSLGILTKFNEITAMKACGVSLYRVALPVVLMAAVVSFFSFYLQENILPGTNRKAEEVWNRIIEIPPRSTSRVDRRWIVGKERTRVFHYRHFDSIADTFSQLTILDIDPEAWRINRRIFAEKGVLQGRELSLVNCWSLDFEEGLPHNFLRKEELFMTLAEDRDFFLSEWKEPGQMNFGDLRDYIRGVEEMGSDTSDFRVALNFKLSFPLVSVIMVLIGIPFAFSMGKRGTLVGIGVTMTIVVVYWVAVSVFRGLGSAGLLSPILAAWGANLIFGLLGLYLLFTLRT
ncbi:MAG: LptF/LptG family permease [Candidatus Aminicenantaceae bacterium]